MRGKGYDPQGEVSMTDAVYAVVFGGEMLEGFSREQVQASFARMLGLNAERLEQLFSRPRTVLKKGLSHAEAVRYRDALQRIGAAVSVDRKSTRLNSSH